MGTRCSGRPSSDMVGATGAAAAAFLGALSAANASPLVTRPPRPVPSTFAGSIPFSARILPAAGEAIAAAGADAAGADDGAAAGASAAGASAGAAAGAAAALASVSIRAKTSPDATVLPSALTISLRTPEAGAGTSSTTLSVSTSMRISSASTASPGCFFQLSSVASEMDSESCGTRTSVIAMVFFRKDECSLFGQHEAFEFGGHGLLEQSTLLLLVLGQITHRRRGRCTAPRVAQTLAFHHILVQMVLDIEPGSLVLRFVLHPDDLLGIAVF